MTTARFDIEIQDRVAKSIRTEIQGIASASRSAFTGIKEMREELARLSSSASNSANANGANTRAFREQAEAARAAATAAARQRLEAERLTQALRDQAQALRDLNSQRGAPPPPTPPPSGGGGGGGSSGGGYNYGGGSSYVRDIGTNAQISSQHLANLSFQLNDVFVSLASGQKPLTVFIQQGAQIGQIMTQAGVGLGALAMGGLQMLGIIKTTTAATEAAALASASARAINIEAAVATVAANIAAAETEIALAVAEGQVATTATATAAATARLTAANAALAESNVAATVTAQAQATAQAELAAARTAAAAATATNLTALGTVAAVAAAGIIATAGAFFLLNKSIKDSDEAKGLKDGLGLTAKEMKKLEDTTVTMGDTAKAVFQVTGAAIWSLIGDPAKAAGNEIKEFFEELTKNTAKEVNAIIGFMVGGYRAITVTWRQLPAAIGDAFVLSVNAAITAINVLVSAASDAVNTFIAANNAMPFSIKLPKIETSDIALMKNEYAGAAAQVGNAWKTEMDAAMAVDYVGGAFSAIRDQSIKNARERLEKQAKDIIENRGAGRSGRGGKSEEEKRSEAMDKLNRELDQQILLLGFYGVALDRENKFQTIKNGLLDKGITLSEQEATSIRNRILLIQDGTRVQEALNKIESAALGPQRDYDANVAAITIALKDNVVSEAEATRQRTLAKNALIKGLDPLRAYNDNIRQSTEFSALYGKELAIQTRAQQLFNDAVAVGKASLEDGRGAFVGTARNEAKREEQTGIFNQIDPKEQAIDTNAYILDNQTALYASIDALRQQDLISEEVAAERKKNLDKAVSDARLTTTSDMLGQLAGLQSSSSKKLAALGKAAAIAQATIDGYRAVQAALIGPPGPPWSFAIAGVTAAMTAANVAKIAGVGFMSGGYTGNMPTNAVAGAVHGQEYVFDAAATKRIGVPALEAMRNGSQLGGVANDNRGFGGNVIIKPEPGVWVEERRTSEGEIEIIARRVARQEAPRAVAQDLARGPNSVASKAVSQSFGIARTKS